MNIQEAIKARTAEKPYIARQKWHGEFSTWKAADIKIQPTNSPDCCIITGRFGSSRGWQPTEEDLMADDWVTMS